ncbi:inositol monophosphatase family protein [Nesterenkonia flava]|uniref:Inositol monophosphatase family protein n=1 Tax=Nesterenkonia flava TaxID=469799 RepID=A0ABU1FQZ5_9MICC|nr:inositol monophosphatase family protein [Nesterenkonia flava]MDR5710777.1 inositol monophosphatase family protein [Nesterenkonia flava]
MERTIQARGTLEGAYSVIMELVPRLDALRTDVTLKGDDTPVTKADLLMQQALAEYLDAQFEDLTFVGEEGSWDAEADPVGWTAVVDPIDGTENFSSSLPEWGVSVSIFYDADHVASMIALPDLGQRLITGDRVTYAQSRITAFSSGISEGLVRRIAATPQSRLIGAAVYNLFGVATGRFTRFINPVGAYSWDLLAGLALALEHNCEVLVDDEPYDGSYLKPGRKYRVDVQHRHDRHPR